MRSPISAVTIVKNRTEKLIHLIAQLEQCSPTPDELVIVWMAPPSGLSLIKSDKFDIVHKFTTQGELPIAKARNKGMQAAKHANLAYLNVAETVGLSTEESILNYFAINAFIVEGEREEYVLLDISARDQEKIDTGSLQYSVFLSDGRPLSENILASPDGLVVISTNNQQETPVLSVEVVSLSNSCVEREIDFTLSINRTTEDIMVSDSGYAVGQTFSTAVNRLASPLLEQLQKNGTTPLV